MKTVHGITKPRLAIIDGVATVSSPAVAEAFGKPHERILQIIGDLLGSTQDEARDARHFLPARDSAGAPMFRLTRDGFTRLVAAFPGRPAKARDRYLAAFDALEGVAAKSGAKAPVPPQDNAPHLPMKRAAIDKLPVSRHIRVFAGAVQGQPALLVDARELHASIAIGRDFSHWIRERIVDYGYVADQDYIKVLPAPPAPRGRAPLAFHLTLEMAKDLTAIEGTTKAKMVKRHLQRHDRHAQGLDALMMSPYPHGGGKVGQAWDSKQGRLVDLRTGVTVAEASLQVSAEPAVTKGGGQSEGAVHTQLPTPADLQFGDTHFNIADRNGQVWLRLSEIEEALGYANKGKGLSTIFHRNSSEFTESMTALVKLPDLHPRNEGAGQIREIRVFSLRGAHLLAIFARTEKAKEFRRWVLDVLDREVAGRYETPQPAAQPDPVPAPANLLPGLNVSEGDFFLAAYRALGRENGMATLLVQLVKMGALDNWINISLRNLADASGGKISKSNIAYNARRLKGEGLIDHEPSRFRVFLEAIRALLPELDKAGLLEFQGAADVGGKITVH
jgi:phage anti-repressor protein